MLQDKRVVASKQQIAADMQGESVILDLKSGIYFGLNQVGTRVWELVQQPIAVQTVQQTIFNEYAVEAERCEQDIQTLLEKLLDAGLLEVLDVENR